MTRPPGGDGEDGESPPTRKSFDDAWREVSKADGAGPDGADGAAPTGETRHWDDEARARREGSSEADAPDEAAEDGETAGTRLGHAGVVAEEVQDKLVADREMDALMRGRMPEVPTDESGIRPKVGLDAPGDDDDDFEATVSGEHPATPAKPALRVLPGGSDDGDDSDAEDAEDADDGTAARDGGGGGDSDGADPEGPRVRPFAARGTSADEPMPSMPMPAADASGSSTSRRLVVGVLAAAAVIGIGWALGFGTSKPEAPPRPSTTPPPAAPIQPTETRRPEAPARPTPTPPVDDDPTTTAGGSDGGAETGTTADSPPRTSNPREPPPGTPPEIAAVFEKLPVSAADRPPVGGIGKSGIHIDRITMGSRYDDGECVGDAKRMSVAEVDRASVCVRVVHPREKEELVVLWKKENGAARRSKMIVKPMHAYRTRAYLKLRSEYVGDWTVQILSDGDIELARYSFTVVQ